MYAPGEDISINFSLDETLKHIDRSSLHILSVDERVRYFGNENDITLEKFTEESKQFYDTKVDSNVDGRIDDRYNDLSKFNTFFITNAYVRKKDCSIGDRIDGQIYSDNDDDRTQGTRRTSEILEAKHIRKNFNETYIFKDVKGSEIKNGKYVFKGKVPDSITSFLVNAFVFHPEHGLGIAEERKFTVIKDFFIKLFLPYSIHVGEVLKVNVGVFNYLKNNKLSVDAKVKFEIVKEKMSRPEIVEYEFVQFTSNRKTCAISSVPGKTKTQTIKVESNSGSSAYFYIRATKEGKLKMKIIADVDGYEDIVEKELLVEYQGISRSNSEGFFVDLRDNSTTSYSFECKFPNNSFINSREVYATVYGNTLGQVISNTESLIKLPIGCPEQTLMTWIPNIVAYDYLNSVGKLTDERRQSLSHNINYGYQKIVLKNDSYIDSYRSMWGSHQDLSKSKGQHKLGDGGKSDYQIWNTAYLVKLLSAANHITSTNSKYVIKSLDYLKNLQKNSSHHKENGSFDDRVHIPYYSSKNEPSSKVPLTAFTISAFLENKQFDDYTDTIRRGVNYLKSEIVNLKKNFEKAIVAYTLILNQEKFKTNETQELISEILDELVKSANYIGNDKMFWVENRTDIMNPVNIETASYAMMALLRSGNDNKYMSYAFKVMNWLMSVKNSVGGYSASHDTGEFYSIILLILYCHWVKFSHQL